TDLTFPEWDRDERGPLDEFPSRSVQPVVLHEPAVVYEPNEERQAEVDALALGEAENHPS
ncbi:MAG: hypothetical protein JWL64_2194, partial [Frankiales bacterium]|nr:hypothetical protein [Frankiales bacterium]